MVFWLKPSLDDVVSKNLKKNIFHISIFGDNRTFRAEIAV
jgi:hypothetical protein